MISISVRLFFVIVVIFGWPLCINCFSVAITKHHEGDIAYMEEFVWV